jgi:putative redox protein
MIAKSTWKGGLSFTGTADSGFAVPLGAKAEVGGDSDGFRPMELIAIGLAGCTAMDVISILRKKRQQVTAFEVQVNAERAEKHPKVFTGAVIEYIVSGHGLTESAVKRALELSATRYCPAQTMLGAVFPIALKYYIYEDKSGDERELVQAGDCTPSMD